MKIYKKELKLMASKNKEYLKSFCGQLLFIQITNVQKDEIKNIFKDIIIMDEEIKEEKECIKFLYKLVDVKSSI